MQTKHVPKMAKIQLKRKGIFPLCRIKVRILDQVFTFKYRRSLEVDVPVGELTITLQMDFWKSAECISVPPSGLDIVVRHILPDIVYYFGITGVVITTVGVWIDMISIWFPAGWVFLYLLPQYIYLLVHWKDYLKMEATDRSLPNETWRKEPEGKIVPPDPLIVNED